MTPGKSFENDFFKSAQKSMFIYRLPDPSSSFNNACRGCEKQMTRFSPRNVCDFLASTPKATYLFELKSHKGKSIPFSAIVTKPTDKRLEKMVEIDKKYPWVKSYFIFNWRDIGNATYAPRARTVLYYINTSDRKSIPFGLMANRFRIPDRLIRVHYDYDMSGF